MGQPDGQAECRDLAEGAEELIWAIFERPEIAMSSLADALLI